MIKPGKYLHHSGKKYDVIFSADHATDKTKPACVCYMDIETGAAWSRPCTGFNMEFISETNKKINHFDIKTNVGATKKDYPVRVFSYKNNKWVWF